MAYVLTLVVEWPFVAWAVRGTPALIRRSLTASLVVQTASYIVIFGWYWSASRTSLYTRMQVVTGADMALPAGFTLYYIGRDDGNVRKQTLALGVHERVVYSLHSSNRNDRLFVRPALTTHQAWDLVARLDRGGSRNYDEVTIESNLVVVAVPDSRSTYTEPPEYPGTSCNFGKVPRLGSASTKPMGGLGRILGGGRHHPHAWGREGRIACRVRDPVRGLRCARSVQLPGDVVVFQLGADQICALDIEARKVALLCRGRGPVVVMEPSTPRRDTL